MIEVSIIIPTHNKAPPLRRTIKSLSSLEKRDRAVEVIVVDNASTDNTKYVVEELQKNGGLINTNLIYIYEERMGLHFARHAGAKKAKGEILVFIDDDIICDGNLLNEILKSYRNLNVACVGGMILPKWEVEPPEWIHMFPKWYLSILDEGGEEREVDWIYGCNFSIRKKFLFDLGGFNPDAFADKKLWWYRGDGEIGLLKKVHRVGKKIIYNPRAVVWHYIPKERLTIEYYKERAFKSGIEASFSHYYYSGDSLRSIKVLALIGAFSLAYGLCNIVALLPYRKSIKYKVTSSYYKARLLYQLKLATDGDLRYFVQQKSWLTMT